MVWIGVCDWIVWWVKVLILLGFDDIGYDIGFFWSEWWKSGNLVGFMVILVEWFKNEVGVWMNQLIDSQKNRTFVLVFTPPRS